MIRDKNGSEPKPFLAKNFQYLVMTAWAIRWTISPSVPFPRNA
jgi:hypothetical protein